jgi:DNA polymerase-3 subunit delta'
MAQLLPENSTLERAVRRAAEQGRLSHAIVLSGDGGLTDAARFIAAAHVCEGTDRPCLRCRHCRKVLEGIHPDVSVIRDTEHRELTVDAVRALRQDVYIRPNEAARKVYIIADSRQLNERDQNVLLKIVEEGPPYAAFIFCTDSPAALLETVRSRCVLLKCDAPAPDALPPEAEQLCRAFARGKLLPVTTYLVSLENRRMKREELRDVLRGAWCAAAEALLLQMGKAVPDPACGETAQVLAGGLDRRRLYGLTALLEKYSGECVYNVGAGHVLGALAVEWEELL